MQKLRFLVTIAFSILLAACSSNPIQGKLSPTDASTKCMATIPPAPPFLPDGHLYTTLSIAALAMLPDERQLAIAYFSQYPDLDPDYEAVPVSLKYLLLPNKWTWRNDISGKLHSLHGGGRKEIDARRAIIRRAITEKLDDPAKDWQTGLLIHALGDTYAHTKNELNSEKEQAYGVWIGHLIPSLFGKSPDKIKTSLNEPKYLAYITDLYQLLSRNPNTDTSFQEFYQFIDDLECEDEQCPNFHALFNTKARSEPARIDKFQTCMNSSMRQLTKSEVQSVMDFMTDISKQ